MANVCGRFSPHLVSVALQVVFQCDPFQGTFSSTQEDPISLFLLPGSPLCSRVRPAEPAATGPKESKGPGGVWEMRALSRKETPGRPALPGRSSRKQPVGRDRAWPFLGMQNPEGTPHPGWELSHETPWSSPNSLAKRALDLPRNPAVTAVRKHRGQEGAVPPAPSPGSETSQGTSSGRGAVFAGSCCWMARRIWKEFQITAMLQF